MITRFYLRLLSTNVKDPKSGCHVTSLCQGLRRSAGSGGEDPENQVVGDFTLSSRVNTKLLFVLFWSLGFVERLFNDFIPYGFFCTAFTSVTSFDRHNIVLDIKGSIIVCKL